VVAGLNPGIVYWMVVSDSNYYNGKLMKIKIAKWGSPNFFFKFLFLIIVIIFLSFNK
jgi:hypothetical protein